MARVIRGFAPEPLIRYDNNRTVIPNWFRNLYPNAPVRDAETANGFANAYGLTRFATAQRFAL